jgi:hypothetical protein
LLVLCWMFMGWSLQTQLSERCREGVELLGRLFYHRRRSGSSYQGLVKASKRYGDGMLKAFWGCLRATIPKRLGQELWAWYGWVVLAVDGSRANAPRTRGNERGLGRAGRDKTHPQWWVTLLIHLPTNLIWNWRQGPGNSAERSHMTEMLDSLPALALLVGDVGFGGFEFLREVADSGAHFLVRCASNTTLLVEATRQKIERVGDHRYVYLWPTGYRSQAPLRLRLVILKRRRARIYLLTNVIDSARLSRAMASQFYKARWGIEVEYRSLKQTLGRRKILAKSPKVGATELAGNILALALLMLQSALAMGACITKLSVTEFLKLIRRLMEALRCRLPTAPLVALFRTATKDEYVRRSSKRARDWPHKKKESPPSPPKLRRPTGAENARIISFLGGPQ